MLLSVIVPYYNSEAWIGKTLDTLLDQDIAASDYEIIVVDDESTQEPVVLKDYADRYPQIRYHRIAHAGLPLARNYGLSVATGEWIYFCDSDDFVQPQVLGGIIRAAQERDLEMILAQIVKINEHDAIPTPRRNFTKVSETMTGLDYFVNPPDVFSWGVWAYLTRRSVLESNGLLFDDITFVEDRLFKLALMQKVTRCATIDVDLYYYVQHNSSIYHAGRKRRNPEFIESFFCYVDRLNALMDAPDTPPQVLPTLQRRRNKSAFIILSNAFLYSPLDVNQASISKLASMELYPVRATARDPRRTRVIKRLMNRRGLWLFLYRIFHLLPASFIHKHFNA